MNSHLLDNLRDKNNWINSISERKLKLLFILMSLFLPYSSLIER